MDSNNVESENDCGNYQCYLTSGTTQHFALLYVYVYLIGFPKLIMNVSLNSNNGLFLVTQIRCVLCEVGAEGLFTHISRGPGGGPGSIPGWSM